MAELDRMAHSVLPPRNPEVTHIVDREHRIWRTGRGQARVLWFHGEAGRLVILSHGFPKKDRKIPPTELDRARRARRDYLKAKESGNLWFQEES
jgi:phage-related protein